MTGNSGIDAGYAAFDLPMQIAEAGRYPLLAQWVTFDSGARRVEGMTDALAWHAK